jgi:hypothetical protein
MKHGLKVLIEHYKSKEHWYIKYLTRGIVSVACFAILVHIFKEVGFLPAQKIFDFLYQWAVVLSASVTLMLAGAAVWAIMDNRYGRRVDRKERLLNEIIEWVVDVVRCGFSVEFPTILEDVSTPPNEGTEIQQRVWRSVYTNLLFKYQTLDAKSEYMQNISLVFGSDLAKHVKKICKKLDNVITFLPEHIKNVMDVKTGDKLSELEHLLQVSGIALIKVATDIKTRDVS